MLQSAASAPMVLPPMVACDRRKMRLTETACTKLWHSAMESPPEPWEGRFACRNCPVGAARAGVVFDGFKAAKEKLLHVCVRCCDLATKLVGGTLCVSCYNRAREVAIGRNRKGTPPKRAIPTGTLELAVVNAAGSLLTPFDRVTGPIEAAMLMARRSTETFYLGRPCPMRPGFFRGPQPRRDRTNQLDLYGRMLGMRASERARKRASTRASVRLPSPALLQLALPL
jgi:hypothetical protein